MLELIYGACLRILLYSLNKVSIFTESPLDSGCNVSPWTGSGNLLTHRATAETSVGDWEISTAVVGPEKFQMRSRNLFC